MNQFTSVRNVVKNEANKKSYYVTAYPKTHSSMHRTKKNLFPHCFTFTTKTEVKVELIAKKIKE